MLSKDIYLPEVLIGQQKPMIDERGIFRRLIDFQEIRDSYNLDSYQVIQSNFSQNFETGTWRGLHAQKEPHAETKIVCCITGSVLDVSVDVRKSSSTYLKHTKITLDSQAGNFVIVPKGFAHGYLTLETNSSVVYFVDEAYSREFEIGFHVDDPALNLEISHLINIISPKDSAWPKLAAY